MAHYYTPDDIYDPKKKHGPKGKWKLPFRLNASTSALVSAALLLILTWFLWSSHSLLSIPTHHHQGITTTTTTKVSTNSRKAFDTNKNHRRQEADKKHAQLTANNNNKQRIQDAQINTTERLASFSPQYRGPGKQEVFPAFADANRVLLATHSRLMWYRYDTNQLTVLHEGQGVYYGIFPGEELDLMGAPTTVWVVSRPHNWRPTTANEWLLKLDINTGEELDRVKIDSHFTHDVVRSKGRVYIANTGKGEIIEMSFPDMTPVRSMELFTLKQHINTLAPTPTGTLWAMLHNLGPSILAEIDVNSGKIIQQLQPIGDKSHGIVFWGPDNNIIIALNSDEAALIKVDIKAGGKVTTLWDSGLEDHFLKGLNIVDDIAFFGIAKKQPRQSRDDPSLNCDLAAYDLKNNVLLFRRKLPTHGLLNIVAAPHLAVESTSWAVPITRQSSYRQTVEYNDLLEAAKQGRYDETGATITTTPVANSIPSGGGGGGGGGKVAISPVPPLPPNDPLAPYPPNIGGYWASGLPYLNVETKTDGFKAGVELMLLKADVNKLKAELLSMPIEYWEDTHQSKYNAFLQGRQTNLNQFKPGTKSIHLIFSDQGGTDVYQFPWYNKFAPLIEPVLNAALGSDVNKIIRAQFALMPPDTHIRRHIDKGGYSQNGHRLHLVVSSAPQVSFHVCSKHDRESEDDEPPCLPLHVEEGLVFELNNRLEHFVDNDSEVSRIHMVVDIAESDRTRTQLKVGQVCKYHGSITC